MPSLFLLELVCLSPDFSNVINRPQVTREEKDGFYIISWTVEIARYSGCSEQVFSMSPLQYNVYLTNAEGMHTLQMVFHKYNHSLRIGGALLSHFFSTDG